MLGLTPPTLQERIGIVPFFSNSSDIPYHGQPPTEVGLLIPIRDNGDLQDGQVC